MTTEKAIQWRLVIEEAVRYLFCHQSIYLANVEHVTPGLQSEVLFSWRWKRFSSHCSLPCISSSSVYKKIHKNKVWFIHRSNNDDRQVQYVDLNYLNIDNLVSWYVCWINKTDVFLEQVQVQLFQSSFYKIKFVFGDNRHLVFDEYAFCKEKIHSIPTLSEPMILLLILKLWEEMAFRNWTLSSRFWVTFAWCSI